MSRFDNFIRLVEAEAVFMCLSRSHAGVRPSAILSVALQCPQQILSTNTEQLRFQAQELTDWFFGGADPEWLPEALMFEEVEEIVEEYIDEEVEDEEEEEFEYSFNEEFVEGSG